MQASAFAQAFDFNMLVSDRKLPLHKEIVPRRKQTEEQIRC